MEAINVTPGHKSAVLLCASLQHHYNFQSLCKAPQTHSTAVGSGPGVTQCSHLHALGVNGQTRTAPTLCFRTLLSAHTLGLNTVNTSNSWPCLQDGNSWFSQHHQFLAAECFLSFREQHPVQESTRGPGTCFGKRLGGKTSLNLILCL